MKKEYFIVIVLILFILSSVFDFLAGPIKLNLRSPYDFLQMEILAIYPLTGVSVLTKTFFITLTLLLGLSLLEKMYLAKGLFLLFFAALCELYAIQQIATKAKTTPQEWTLGFAGAGLVLFLPAIVFLLWGGIKTVLDKTKTIPS